MVLIVVVIAIALYGVLYFYGEFLTQNHGVGTDLLYTLQQIIFRVPSNTYILLYKAVLGIMLLYLLLEALVNALRPKPLRRRRKNPFWRSRNSSS